MIRSVNPGDESQPLVPPPPEALARWLLAAEAGEPANSEALAAAGEHIYLRLRVRLAVLLGSTGFDALWARAMHLAQPAFCAEDDTAVAESLSVRTSGLHAIVYRRDSALGERNLVLAFASFITLLYTFIGAELGFRFIRQLWPDLPPDAAESQADRATP